MTWGVRFGAQTPTRLLVLVDVRARHALTGFGALPARVGAPLHHVVVAHAATFTLTRATNVGAGSAHPCVKL